MTAVAAELQAQVDDLNDERVRLLKKLRDGAASGAAAAAGLVDGEAGKGIEEQQQNVSNNIQAGDRREWGDLQGDRERLFPARQSIRV